jgi:hypothetical protein
MAEQQPSVDNMDPLVIWTDPPHHPIPSNDDQTNSAAAVDAARQLFLFLQTYTDFRLAKPVNSEKDCLGLHDLAINLSAPTPPPASLLALSKLPLDNLHVQCVCKCPPSALLDLFEYIYHAILADPETRNYTLRLRSFAVTWCHGGLEYATTVHERLFTLHSWRKVKLGQGHGQWPTFLFGMNDAEDMGAFRVTMELRDEKDLRYWARLWGVWSGTRRIRGIG